MTVNEILMELAKRLRSRANWLGGYYSPETDCIKQDIYESIAAELEEMCIEEKG